ncbi:MAG: hypothetical protein JWO58_3010 [Chitinophagaceae bacterium]|nr:hypothetical protein [Chitinophagaceae bacterium]
MFITHFLLICYDRLIHLSLNFPRQNIWFASLCILIGWFSAISSYGQNTSENSISMGIEQSSIASNEPFIIYLSFPSSFKKEFKAAQNLIFPDIPDLVKGQTTYQDDKELKVAQWYWPRKPGSYTIPPIKFTIRDYEVTMPSKNLSVKANKSSFSYTPPSVENGWQEHNPDIELLFSYPKTPVYERELFQLELSLLVPVNNQSEWTFIDVQEQIQHLNKQIGATGLLIQTEFNKNIPFDTLEKDHIKFYKYTIYKGQSLSIDTTKTKIPPLSFRYVCYQTLTEEKGLFNKKIQTNRKAVIKELSTKAVTLSLQPLPEHPLSNEVAVGTFHLKPLPVKYQQRTKGFNFSFEIEGPKYLISIHEPWISSSVPGLHISLSKRTVQNTVNGQKTKFEYFIHADSPKNINIKNCILWVYFNPLKRNYDTLSVDQPVMMTTEVNNNEEIVGEDSFLQLLYKASNTEYSLEKDESLNRFANLIIFLLFLAISVLIFKR